jgi:hypothetical protein
MYAKFILSKLKKKHQISWVVHPNRNWNWVHPLIPTINFEHTQTPEFELEANSFPPWIWNFQLNSIPYPIHCIQTKRWRIELRIKPGHNIIPFKRTPIIQ